MILMEERRSLTFSLVEKAKSGDREALGRLFETFRPRLEAVVRGILSERLQHGGGAADVLQETFTRACTDIARFEWRDEDSFLRWLSVIARNVILEEARREKVAPGPLPERDPSAAGLSPSRRLRREERFDRLEGAMQQLSPLHRQVISLARIEKLPLKEVAARLGRSHDAVRQLLRRALQEMKANFGDTESLGLPHRRLDGGESHEK